MRTLPLCIWLAVTVGASAQTEHMVNVTRDSSQRAPRIASAADGRMLVVWQSFAATDPHRPRIVMRWLAPDGTPDGAEFAVAPTPRPTGSWRFRHQGAQEQPALAMHPSGVAAIAWVQYDSLSSYDIRLRIVRGSTVVDVSVSDQVGENTAQSHPSVDMNESGVVALAWDTWEPGATHQSVRVRFFDTTGTPLGSSFRLNDSPGPSNLRPVIRLRPDSSALVVWETWAREVDFLEPDGTLPIPSSSGTGLLARVVRPEGPSARPAALMNRTMGDYQWQAALERSNDGYFVVWCSWEQDGDDGAIVGRALSAEGTPVSEERILNATTRFHQWLPRIVRRPGGYVAVWSSWKTDGDREGVFAALLDQTGRRMSFESQVNLRGESFQWEPDAVVLNDSTAVVVWAEWFGEGLDYDVMVRRLNFERPVGTLKSGTPNSGGRSTAMFVPHVVDRSALTGHRYEAAVTSVVGDTAEVSVTDMSVGQVKLGVYRLDRGTGFQYLTPPFDGIRLEIVPQFRLELDQSRSGLRSELGTPPPFLLTLPTAGSPNLAPIDIDLTFGSNDTLPDGSYAFPMDTAINVSGQRIVRVPFKAWNATDSARVDLLIVDMNTNARWDRGERIIFRTPLPYRTASNNTHAELSPGLLTARLPQQGDVYSVYTVRPMTTSDRYQFIADPGLVVRSEEGASIPRTLRLEQNFPNPFNPMTRIAFELDRAQWTVLEVYDILGRRVEVLVNEERSAGRHVATFDARGRSSGMYIAVLRTGGTSLARTMVLVK